MLAEERRNRVIEVVHRHGTVSVQHLAEDLDVSAMTIRRDLAELSAQGLVERVHGGAAVPASSVEPAFAEKMSQHAAEKAAIAAAALAHVRLGMSLAFSAGTTCTRLAQALAGSGNAAGRTIVTNSLPVAEEFFRAPASRTGAPATVLLTGGERTPSDALVGPLADAALEGLRVDLLFLGAHGVGPDGLSTPNLQEARTNRAMVHAGRSVIALFDASKWGVTGLAGFASWREIDTVVTTPGLPADALAFIRESVCEVVIA